MPSKDAEGVAMKQARRWLLLATALVLLPQAAYAQKKKATKGAPAAAPASADADADSAAAPAAAPAPGLLRRFASRNDRAIQDDLL